MPNVLVVELRSAVVEDDPEAPLSRYELDAITKSVNLIRAGTFAVTDEEPTTPSVRWYRRAEQSD